MASSQPQKDSQPATAASKPDEPTTQKSAAALEEDDEFEDFPVEGMPSLSQCSPFPFFYSPRMRCCYLLIMGTNNKADRDGCLCEQIGL